jgi:hypothetical protein
MQVRQKHIERNEIRAEDLSGFADFPADLVILFGSVEHFNNPGFAEQVTAPFPGAAVIGCTTAGEITRDGVSDGTCVITAIRFEGTSVRVADAEIPDIAHSFSGGEALAGALPADGLAGVFVLGKGVAINGSALIDGMVAKLGTAVPVSGGLAGDNGAFQRTLVLSNRAVHDSRAVAVGFYGDRVRLNHGSFGGWQPFGPTRKVTKASGNILFELDGEPALNIYKRYLGDYAKDLPASGLLFPFEMLNENHDAVGLIRTILGISEADGSLILAGAIEEGGYLRLMHASADALVQGAENAAAAAAGPDSDGPDGDGPDSAGPSGVALLVSCIGRKLVLGDQVDEEVDAVSDRLGSDMVIAGFYSNGEICPMRGVLDCRLHNQTMTVTLLSEQ